MKKSDPGKAKNDNILCQYTDPISNRKFSVVILYTSVIGRSINTVYLGKLVENNKDLCKVAIKQILISKHQNIENNKEIEVMKSLQHENIVKLFYVFKPPASESDTDNQMLNLIMEYCEGKDLKNHMLEHPKLSESQIRDYFRQIVGALNYLHSKDILHRDIKPHNIFLTNQNKTIKIGDFGNSRFCKMSMTSITQYNGTVGYMAPEVINKKISKNGTYGPQADIFSLGVTLYYLYFGKEPWFSDSNTGSHYCGDLLQVYKNRLSQDNLIFPKGSKISPDAQNLISKMLRFDADQRIKMKDLLKDPYLKDGNEDQKLEYLCEFIADTNSNEKRIVEFNDFFLLGHYNFTVNFGLLKNEQGKVISNLAIKHIFLENHMEKEWAEIELMNKLHHENLVNLVYIYKPQTKRKYVRVSLIMEFCEGLDLHKYLERNQNMSEWKIRDYFKQIVSGLACLHSGNVLHRDLKLHNLLLTKNSKTIKIAGYGISNFIKYDINSLTVFKGTHGFMAPEVIDSYLNHHKDYGFPADIFSLGVILYFMYCRKLPWSYENKKEEDESVLFGDVIEIYKKTVKKGYDMFPVDIEIDFQTKKLILKMLEIDPFKRVQLSDIIDDPYFKADTFPKVQQRTSEAIFLRVETATNKIVLAQDILRNIYKYDSFCEDKILWLKSLAYFSRFIEMSALSLKLQIDGKTKTLFGDEEWKLFLEDDLCKNVIAKKIKQILVNSGMNSDTLFEKLKQQEVAKFEEIVNEDFNIVLLLTAYKEKFQTIDLDKKDKLLELMYKLMTLLNCGINSINDNFNLKTFQENLSDSLKEKRWIIIQRLEVFLKKLI